MLLEVKFLQTVITLVFHVFKMKKWCSYRKTYEITKEKTKGFHLLFARMKPSLQSITVKRTGSDTEHGTIYLMAFSTDRLSLLIMDELRKQFMPILDAVEKITDPRHRLTVFLRKFTLRVTSSPATATLAHEFHRMIRKHQYEIKSIWRRSYKILKESIKELHQEGAARKGRSSFLAFLGAGLVFWIPEWFDCSRQINEKELADTVNRVFLDGLLLPESKKEKPSLTLKGSCPTMVC